MVRPGIIFLAVCATCVQSIKIHEYMTSDEIKSVFQTTDDGVPEYEVVPVKHTIQKRSLDDLFSVVFLKVFGSDLRLYLEPTEGLLAGSRMRMWTAAPDKSVPNGIKYELISNTTSETIKTYHDLKNMASVIVDEDESGNKILEGTIGSNLVVRPLPHRFHDLVSEIIKKNRKRRFSIENLGDDFKDALPHIVFKKPDIKEIKALKDPIRKLSKMVAKRVSRFLPPKGGIVYPEVMVFMDYDLYSIFKNDTNAAKKYILSFWNGVDLRYRLLGDPSIRFNIVGIILSTESPGVPFVVNNIVNEKMIDADKALIDLGQHLYKEKTFVHGQDYDIFMALTKYDMCNYDEPKTFCNNEGMGYAYVATACHINETTKMVEAIGMVEDNGGFKGIIPTAHEVGHVLGATHDSTTDPKIKCELLDGYIMAGGFMLSENGFEWSPCSQNNFTAYLNGPDSECLRNKPEPDTKLERILPGMYLSLADQCNRLFNGSHPCKVDEHVCLRLECYIPEAKYCHATAPAAEGSECGDDLICINGKCVSRKSTSVPHANNKTEEN